MVIYNLYNIDILSINYIYIKFIYDIYQSLAENVILTTYCSHWRGQEFSSGGAV